MKREIEFSKPLGNTVITIGTFDGVHIGHRKIIKRIVESAENSALESAVLTFFPHPRMVLQKEVDKDSLDGQSLTSDVLQTTKLSLPRMMTYFSKYRKSNTNSTNRSFNTNVTNSL